MLAEYGDSITGVTSLTDGADQLFARAVLDRGGQIEVIVPAARYRDSLPRESHPEYDDFIDHAVKVHRLDFTESTAESHMAASELMISMVSELLAVWDGQPARGYGDTADVVAHARDHGRTVRCGSSGQQARPVIEDIAPRPLIPDDEFCCQYDALSARLCA